MSGIVKNKAKMQKSAFLIKIASLLVKNANFFFFNINNNTELNSQNKYAIDIKINN